MTLNSKKPLALLAVAVAVVGAGCADFATEPDRTPSEVRVTPDSLLVMTGESAAFQVELLDENGEAYEVIPAWAPPQWTSDRPDRVEIDGGTVTPIRGGENLLDVDVAGVQGRAVLRANPTELSVSAPLVYITQSVQRPEGDVTVVAGRDGLLRVIVVGDDENYYRPTVQATFRNGGEVVHTVTLELENGGLPVVVDEGRLTLSYDAEIPGSVLQPGVGLVLEIDPDGVVPARSGSELRVPATGVLELAVREVPPFRLMMVPVRLASHDGRESRLTPDYAADRVRLMEDIFPFGEFDLSVREPFVTDAQLNTEQGWFQLLEEIATLRYDDGNPHYYYGGFDRPSGTNIGGLGYVGFPVAIGMDNRDDIIAHEIGHTVNLPHAPCGVPGAVDPEYPHLGGVVGVYGYSRSRGRVQPPSRYDLMSYCDPIWISDYNYERVLVHRDTSVFDAALEGDGAAVRAAGVPTLLVQGGVLDGRLRLAPALESVGPVILPGPGGAYTLEGLDAVGGMLFSVAVEPVPLDHGGAQFLVALPLELARPDQLARLRLRGPEGVAERVRGGAGPRVQPEARLRRGGPGSPGSPARRVVQWDAGEYPLAVIRDRDTGRIRAMSRTGTMTVPGADPSRFDVLLSDGVGSRAARVIQR